LASKIQGPIPYHLTLDLKDILGLPPEFYYALRELFFRHAGLKLFATAIFSGLSKNTRAGALTQVAILEYIAMRTMEFSKRFEFIKLSEFLEGELKRISPPQRH
jgi:hypothetical protein